MKKIDYVRRPLKERMRDWPPELVAMLIFAAGISLIGPFVGICSWIIWQLGLPF